MKDRKNSREDAHASVRTNDGVDLAAMLPLLLTFVVGGQMFGELPGGTAMFSSMVILSTRGLIFAAFLH